MEFSNGRSYAEDLEEPRSAGEIMVDYLMDLCESVYYRMDALGIGKKELADRMGKKPSQITRILSGEANVTLQTVAQLDEVLGLGISLKGSFECNPPRSASSDTVGQECLTGMDLVGSISPADTITVADTAPAGHSTRLTALPGGLAA